MQELRRCVPCRATGSEREGMRKRRKKALARDRFWIKLATLANYVIAQHGPEGIEEIKLWWIIWRSDIEATRRWGTSITGARWLKGNECPEPCFHWPTWRDNETSRRRRLG